MPEQVILDVEKAREFVRSKGLNPRDIHLKNVLMQDGRAKVLDVSEYVKEGDDKRWEHLVWAYHTFYSGISEVKVPSWILDTIKNGTTSWTTPTLIWRSLPSVPVNCSLNGGHNRCKENGYAD